MSARICLVTTGQPACNPRLVKEADALVDAGFDVHVVAAYSADWATDADRDLARSRRWSQTFVDWRFGSAPWVFWASQAFGDRRFNWDVEQHVFLNTVRAVLDAEQREPDVARHDRAADATHPRVMAT